MTYFLSVRWVRCPVVKTPSIFFTLVSPLCVIVVTVHQMWGLSPFCLQCDAILNPPLKKENENSIVLKEEDGDWSSDLFAPAIASRISYFRQRLFAYCPSSCPLFYEKLDRLIITEFDITQESAFKSVSRSDAEHWFLNNHDSMT